MFGFVGTFGDPVVLYLNTTSRQRREQGSIKLKLARFNLWGLENSFTDELLQKHSGLSIKISEKAQTQAVIHGKDERALASNAYASIFKRSTQCPQTITRRHAHSIAQLFPERFVPHCQVKFNNRLDQSLACRLKGLKFFSY